MSHNILLRKDYLKILQLLDIKFIVIKSDKDLKKVLNLIKFSISKKPVACIVDRNTFSKTQPIQNKTIDNNLYLGLMPLSVF